MHMLIRISLKLPKVAFSPPPSSHLKSHRFSTATDFEPPLISFNLIFKRPTKTKVCPWVLRESSLFVFDEIHLLFRQHCVCSRTTLLPSFLYLACDVLKYKSFSSVRCGLTLIIFWILRKPPTNIYSGDAKCIILVRDCILSQNWDG